MNSNLKSYIAQNFYYNKVRESEVTGFPFAKDLGSTDSVQMNIAQFEIGEGLQAKLNKVSQNNAPNEFVILQTVCVAMLYRYGVKNAIILTPGMSGKPGDSREITGIFSTIVNGDDSFGTVINSLKQQFQDIMKYKLQDLLPLIDQLRTKDLEVYTS